MKTERIVVCRNTWDWQLVYWLTGSSVPEGSVVKCKQFLVGDRPARIDQLWPWNEIDRIEPQANAAPKIGSAPELAGYRDVHVIVSLRRDNICGGKLLDIGIRLFSTGLKQENFKTKMVKLDRKRYSDWSRSNNTNVMRNVCQAIERF